MPEAWTKDPLQVRDAMMRATLARIPHAPLFRMPKLSPLDRRELADEPARVLARRRAKILAYSDAFLNASPEDLAEHAYGYALQQKELERHWRYAFPMPKDQADPLATLRQASDAELLSMARLLGVHGQDADSGEAGLG